MGLQTHSNYAKISIHATNAFFLTDVKILWTDATHTKISTRATNANFLTHA